MSDEIDYLTDWLREPITKAEALGHTVESDPPAALTRGERWTCTACGDAVLRYGNVIYGSAVERECGKATS